MKKRGYMWRILIVIVVFVVVTGGVVWFGQNTFRAQIVSPIGKILEKPLDKYTIDRLSQRAFTGSQIILDEAVATTSTYTVYQFHFLSDNKRVTGLAHVPAQADIPASDTGNQRIKQYPVIVQFRGYVDREKYAAGEGTRKSAEVFARNGFISLALDFLGYGGPASPERQQGGSASPSADIFEERFETYTTALNLLASIKTLPMADSDRIGVWGHSNGGQIALTVLEVLQKPIPTTLWAPVSKPFPYSILYYTDEATDRGKLIRKRLAKFEEDYDVELYSLPNYLERIAAPLQIHQGTADESVPQKWSDELVKALKEKPFGGVQGLRDVMYFVYPGADHNMVGAWNTVISRDIEFFRNHLK